MPGIHTPPMAFDEPLFRLINRDGGPLLDRIATALSANGFGISIGALLCGSIVWILRGRALRPLVALGVALLLSDFVGAHTLRPLLGRIRPCYTLPAGSFRWLSPAANAGSLPSLHSANFFALAFVGALALPARWRTALYGVATAVALSRIYVGVHWPSDVIAGAIWGTAAGAAGWALSGRVRAPRDEPPGRSAP